MQEEEINQFVHHLSTEIIAAMIRREYSQETGVIVIGRLMVELGARLYMTSMDKDAIIELKKQRVPIAQIPAVRGMVEQIAKVARQVTDEGMRCV
jgi:TPP-dependent 2-oxoacid decarboxylase